MIIAYYLWLSFVFTIISLVISKYNYHTLRAIIAVFPK